MNLSVSPLWIIRNNYEDRVLQVFFVDIHSLQEVLLLQVFCTVKFLILQVVSSSYMNTHQLTGLLGDFLRFSFLIHLSSIIIHDFIKSLVYFGNKSLPRKRKHEHKTEKRKDANMYLNVKAFLMIGILGPKN